MVQRNQTPMWTKQKQRSPTPGVRCNLGHQNSFCQHLSATLQPQHHFIPSLPAHPVPPPHKIYQHFASELAKPLVSILNASFRQSQILENSVCHPSPMNPKLSATKQHQYHFHNSDSHSPCDDFSFKWT